MRVGRGCKSDALPSIHLVRSARTALSAEGRFTGRLDPPLDGEGLTQARAAARSLADAGVSAVFTSPLRRAAQTADAIARWVGVRLEVVDELTDLDMGASTGLTMQEASSASPREFDWFFRMPRAAELPGGGRMSEALRRTLGALEEIAARTAGGGVVVVTHELPIRLVLVKLRELEGTALWDPVIPPGSIRRLRVSGEGLQIPTVLGDLFRAAGRRPG